MNNFSTSLPVDAYLPGIVDHLNQHTSLVLQAAPGTGKTTRVPAALLDAAFRGADGEIWVLEPRRLAAKLSAQRVAAERSQVVGEDVGYQFRFEKVLSPRTRLTFLTEGMLMRRLMNNPSLTGVAAVILDEFHERHLHADVALAYLRHLQKTQRPDLRLLVMSATLDSEAIATYLGGCRIVRIEGKRFEVGIDYLSAVSARPLEMQVVDAVSGLLENRDRSPGDILVFLPGMAEIRRAQAAVEKSHPAVLAVPLHGALPAAEQDRALKSADRTKVILSTNVAESSLTIPGVTAVVDSGLERSAGYSHWSGVPTLNVRPISCASADQRAGRAGRTAPGRCVRLYTKRDFETRPLFATPEIQRADLTQTVLELRSLRIDDVQTLAWFDAPPGAALKAADVLLRSLGALNGDNRLTDIGRRMGRFAAHPRLVRMMIEAGARGNVEQSATLAALIQEGELEELDALAQLERQQPSDFTFRRARDQFLEMAREFGGESIARKKSADFASVVLSGFPDRVAQKPKTIKPGSSRVPLLLSSGGSATVMDAPIVRSSSVFIVLDVLERDALYASGSQLHVRALIPLSEDHLLEAGDLLSEKTQTLWDAERERVVGVSRLCYGELTLIESRQTPTDSRAAARVLAREGFHLQPDRFSAMTVPEFLTHAAALPGSEGLASLAARLDVLKQHMPEADLPSMTAESLGAWVLDALEGFSSVAETKGLSIAQLALEKLPSSIRPRLDEWLPLYVPLSKGRRVAVQYELGKAPWVESRLQDFFGMKQGPRILNGRLPLTLHLLAPNRRPIQITTDLAGFWERAYAETRPQLSRRYPRHPWPENPIQQHPGSGLTK